MAKRNVSKRKAQKQEVKTLLFRLRKVRAFTKDDGAIWFFAKDVAKAMLLNWDRRTLKGIPFDERGVKKVKGKTYVTLNELGAYELAFTSKNSLKPQGHMFVRWLCSEAAPMMRGEIKEKPDPLDGWIPNDKARELYPQLNYLIWKANHSVLYGGIKDRYQINDVIAVANFLLWPQTEYSKNRLPEKQKAIFKNFEWKNRSKKPTDFKVIPHVLNMIDNRLEPQISKFRMLKKLFGGRFEYSVFSEEGLQSMIEDLLSQYSSVYKGIKELN